MLSWKLKFHSYKISNFVREISTLSDPQCTLNTPAMSCIRSLLKKNKTPKKPNHNKSDSSPLNKKKIKSSLKSNVLKAEL